MNISQSFKTNMIYTRAARNIKEIITNIYLAAHFRNVPEVLHRNLTSMVLNCWHIDLPDNYADMSDIKMPKIKIMNIFN